MAIAGINFRDVTSGSRGEASSFRAVSIWHYSH